jgi:hypothetical protein
LAAGSSATFKHGLNDSRAHLTFQVKGSQHSFDAHFIDLWRGEGWVFEIQPDGTVKQGYEHAGVEVR